MQIHLLTPKFNRFSQEKVKNNYNNASYPKLGELQQDTVSFSGKLPQKPELTEVARFVDAFRLGYESRIPSYKVLAARLMDTLDATARELQDIGLIFDREYCTEEHMVKGSRSFISKLLQKPSSSLLLFEFEDGFLSINRRGAILESSIISPVIMIKLLSTKLRSSLIFPGHL